ncbi:MAG TPA: selenide, water dikinase SelD, partial [Candidatus Angelobacter sp.]|nr:selenide, water dikinase SelD [Candidatus Angelobacter sp.]
MLGKLARQNDPNVLVGFDTADDAGVYKISATQALVQTVDFFTPIVDDPYTFGQIAATNSLSDVYAMGGRPLSALAIVCFPEKGDLDVLQQILAGGLSKMMEAGCAVIGGHSVRDPEIKFGYAVTGTINPERVWKNSSAKAGDRLILTKGLGTGVISTAIKRGEAKQQWIDTAVKSMTTLNAKAAQVAIDRQFAIHAATDITGFGLIGHAREMAAGSGVSLRIEAAKVPLLEGALECVRAKFIPGGLTNNRDFAECMVSYGESVPEEIRTMLYDPQTAGGLLFSVAEADSERLVDALRNVGVPGVEIGAVLPAGKPLIQI